MSRTCDDDRHRSGPKYATTGFRPWFSSPNVEPPDWISRRRVPSAAAQSTCREASPVAVIDATVRRARPILLTAGTAIFAMIPLSRSVFWGPMAVALMGGLLVATALTLLFLPALYAAWFRVKREPASEAKPLHHEPPHLAIAAE